MHCAVCEGKQWQPTKSEPADKPFLIRREVLNLNLVQWKVILDGLDLTKVTPRKWIVAMGGKGGFLTAKLNDEEREFVRIVYLKHT